TEDSKPSHYPDPAVTSDTGHTAHMQTVFHNESNPKSRIFSADRRVFAAPSPPYVSIRFLVNTPAADKEPRCCNLQRCRAW
ncbi:hypothetical protein STEG23_018845, partial [Scotinomys teguina]